jgi:hypothetical protein
VALDFRPVVFDPREADGAGATRTASGVIYSWRPTRPVDEGVGAGRLEMIWSPNIRVNGAPVTADLPVTDTPITYGIEVKTTILNDGAGKRISYTETVEVPPGLSVPFEELTRLNPATLGPITELTSGQELRLQVVEAAIAAGGGSGGGAPPGTGVGGKYKVEDLEGITAIGIALGKATSQANGRSAIGAGTSNLAIGTAAGTAAEGDKVVTLAGTQTITGAKTFSTNPVLNAAAIPQTAVATLVADLAGKAAYPAGGTTGQALVKSGSTTAWATATGHVFVIECAGGIGGMVTRPTNSATDVVFWRCPNAPVGGGYPNAEPVDIWLREVA